MLYEQVARIGKAASSPKRLELIELLCQGEKTVDTLAREASISMKLAGAHLPFARSIPIDELKLRLSELPKGKTVVAYCRGPYCLMARDAVELLRKKGYDALRLPESVAEWGLAPVR